MVQTALTKMLKLCNVPEEVTEATPLVVYTKEAARMVKVSVNEFRGMVKRGEIKAKVRGDRLLFLVSDLEEYLRSLPDYKSGDTILPKHLRR